VPLFPGRFLDTEWFPAALFTRPKAIESTSVLLFGATIIVYHCVHNNLSCVAIGRRPEPPIYPQIISQSSPCPCLCPSGPIHRIPERSCINTKPLRVGYSLVLFVKLGRFVHCRGLLLHHFVVRGLSAAVFSGTASRSAVLSAVLSAVFSATASRSAVFSLLGGPRSSLRWSRGLLRPQSPSESGLWLLGLRKWPARR
jgi:hypothetical protein